jgi:hypothetical protein
MTASVSLRQPRRPTHDRHDRPCLRLVHGNREKEPSSGIDLVGRPHPEVPAQLKVLAGEERFGLEHLGGRTIHANRRGHQVPTEGNEKDLAAVARPPWLAPSIHDTFCRRAAGLRGDGKTSSRPDSLRGPRRGIPSLDAESGTSGSGPAKLGIGYFSLSSREKPFSESRNQDRPPGARQQYSADTTPWLPRAQALASSRA